MEKNSNQFLKDIRYHFDLIKRDILSSIVEYNKNSSLLNSLNYILSKIELCENIIDKYDNHNFRLLADNINEILKDNPEIHLVNVHIVVTKHSSPIDFSKQVKLNFLI